MREIRLLTKTSTQIRIPACAESSDPPFHRGARNNYRKLMFWQVFLSQCLGKEVSGLPRWKSPPTLAGILLCYDRS
jgi:hypothetical protein